MTHYGPEDLPDCDPTAPQLDPPCPRCGADPCICDQCGCDPCECDGLFEVCDRCGEPDCICDEHDGKW